MILKIEEIKRKRKASGGNRREKKLKNKMKELRQLIAWTGNKLYSRKKPRKTTNKKKDLERSKGKNRKSGSGRSRVYI